MIFHIGLLKLLLIYFLLKLKLWRHLFAQVAILEFCKKTAIELPPERLLFSACLSSYCFMVKFLSSSIFTRNLSLCMCMYDSSGDKILYRRERREICWGCRILLFIQFFKLVYFILYFLYNYSIVQLETICFFLMANVSSLLD